MCFPVLSLGLVASHRVEQSPPDMIKNYTDSAQLYCSYVVKNFEHIHWYKQSKERNLIYLGYNNLKYTYSEQDTKINLDDDMTNNATLTINNLIAKDSTVYFCAIQIHSVSVSPPPRTKTHISGYIYHTCTTVMDIIVHATVTTAKVVHLVNMTIFY